MGKKLFFALLILLAVLYVGPVGYRLIAKDESGGKTQGPDLSAADNPVVKALNAVLSPFAPSLDLAGLSCGGQPVEKIFRLSESNPTCDLRLRNEDEDHRKGQIKIYQASTVSQVYVYVEPSDEGMPGEKVCKRRIDDSGLQLRVVYQAGDAPLPAEVPNELGGNSGCWYRQDLAEPVSLSVGEGGGRLRLRCVGCDSDQDRHLRLRIK